MSKYSLKNIMLGFGIGLVVTSMLNLNAGQKQPSVDDIKKEAEKYNLVVLDQNELVNQQQDMQLVTPTPTPAPPAGPTGEATVTPTPPAKSTPPKTTAVQPEIQINIAEGLSSEAIASLLADKGLLTDKKAFLDRLDKLGKAGRLHSGKFQIKKGTNIDGIISILTK